MWIVAIILLFHECCVRSGYAKAASSFCFHLSNKTAAKKERKKKQLSIAMCADGHSSQVTEGFILFAVWQEIGVHRQTSWNSCKFINETHNCYSPGRCVCVRVCAPDRPHEHNGSSMSNSVEAIVCPCVSVKHNLAFQRRHTHSDHTCCVGPHDGASSSNRVSNSQQTQHHFTCHVVLMFHPLIHSFQLLFSNTQVKHAGFGLFDARETTPSCLSDVSKVKYSSAKSLMDHNSLFLFCAV